MRSFRCMGCVNQILTGAHTLAHYIILSLLRKESLWWVNCLKPGHTSNTYIIRSLISRKCVCARFFSLFRYEHLKSLTVNIHECNTDNCWRYSWNVTNSLKCSWNVHIFDLSIHLWSGSIQICSAFNLAFHMHFFKQILWWYFTENSRTAIFHF